ncbi:filament-like plant protein 4 isoform X2 [Phalaenopsis equestris]|uniref:filament-like plant protein 4 isoform X2 n=1 Tax=Phalaenopsis equestris TaxID=78828 RepID=UPI0009E2E352|nr:filament-like plant protein 4 isoform X2 [Phalaenopsis equestris]
MPCSDVLEIRARSSYLETGPFPLRKETTLTIFGGTIWTTGLKSPTQNNSVISLLFSISFLFSLARLDNPTSRTIPRDLHFSSSPSVAVHPNRSRWEKAESEALALKRQLESVTLLKLTSEERALHLDSALKECMIQARNVKEESEQRLHDVIFTRTKQWEKVKAELESRISVFDQELLKASAENSVLSRALQERSNLLKKVSEEKSQADAEIEVLKDDLQSCEREISSLKYELHVISKELEIRNEEKNMSMRSAEVANKQHQEDVKKITKLDAECQRLRGLVRKKLPGPAALAQMKQEVENVGLESRASRLRKSSSKCSSPHQMLPSDFALENNQQVHMENELLSARLLVMEEEMKLLQEALSKCNDELKTSKDNCAKQPNKPRLVLTQQKNSSIPNIDFCFGNESKPPSLTSLSEDGFREEVSSSKSCPTALYSEISHSKKERDYDTVNKPENSNYLELMDDFLEMERLACLSIETNGNMDMSIHLETDKLSPTFSSHSENNGYSNIQKCAVSELSDLTAEHASTENDCLLLVLKSRIISLFESQAHDTTAKKIIEDIRHIIQDAQEDKFKEQTESIDGLAEQKHGHKDLQEITDDGKYLNQDSNLCTKIACSSDQELKDVIFHIYEFVLTLVKGDAEIQDSSNDLLNVGDKIERFLASIDSFKRNEVSLDDFIRSLSRILHEIIDLGNKMRTVKGSEGEGYGSDCIDKEALLENKAAQHEESLPEAVVAHTSFSSEFDSFQIKTALPMLSLENFDHLKVEKVKVEMDLVRCKEMLSQSNFTLVDTEKQVLELKSELASCQKSNSLVAIQLKCMAESYKILESQKEEFEVEISRLHAMVEALDNELQEERLSHQEDLAKYNELQEQIDRKSKFPACTLPSNSDGTKTQQEIDIAAAADKLAECQETIFLLGKQLQAMRDPAELLHACPRRRIQRDDLSLEESDGGNSNSPAIFGTRLSDRGDQTAQRAGESPLHGCNSHTSPSDSESSPFSKSPVNTNYHKQKTLGSSSSSSSFNSVSERHRHGFARFFSKGNMDK